MKPASPQQAKRGQRRRRPSTTHRRPARPGRASQRRASRLHIEHRTLVEDAFYPPHAPRNESAAYAAIHQRLVHQEDRACLVCGVRNSTLADPRHNLFGAGAMETHHALIEWSLAGAVDLAKFNAEVVAKFRLEKPEEPLYRRPFSRAQMDAWIDHHPDNLWVLCDVHHRHKGVGIHAISGPIWGAQPLLRARYELGSPETLEVLRKLMGT